MTSDSSKPRIVFVNRSYWPDVEATGQLLTQLCEGLADEFQVEVVAGLPNSLSADAPADWKSQTVHNGVRIHRLRHLQLPKRRMILIKCDPISHIVRHVSVQLRCAITRGKFT